MLYRLMGRKTGPIYFNVRTRIEEAAECSSAFTTEVLLHKSKQLQLLQLLIAKLNETHYVQIPCEDPSSQPGYP